MKDFWTQARAESTYISGIWKILGFFLSCVKIDWMHVACLGILQYLNGNCLWELFQALGGTFRNSKGACNKLENMAKVCAGRIGIEPPIRQLTVAQIRKNASSKPKFKCKAANGRHFLPVLREMLRTCFPCESAHDKRRLHCVEALLRCYEEMETWGPGVSPHRLATSGKQHLLLFCELRREDGMSDLMWRNLFPKHHLFAHCLDSSITNPRLEWNYAEESEIGLAVRQSMKLHKLHVPTQVMQRNLCTFEV